MKVHLFFIGKPRDRAANEMAAEYVKRTSRFARCEMRGIHAGRFDPWAQRPNDVKVALDPVGKTLDSAEFIAMLADYERDGRDVLFLIGGADGLPKGWAERADERIALSRMTLPHELARVVLAEQIYRAFTTLRGHPYPR